MFDKKHCHGLAELSEVRDGVRSYPGLTQICKVSIFLTRLAFAVTIQITHKQIICCSPKENIKPMYQNEMKR